MESDLVSIGTTSDSLKNFLENHSYAGIRGIPLNVSRNAGNKVWEGYRPVPKRTSWSEMRRGVVWERTEHRGRERPSSLDNVTIRQPKPSPVFVNEVVVHDFVPFINASYNSIHIA